MGHLRDKPSDAAGTLPRSKYNPSELGLGDGPTVFGQALTEDVSRDEGVCGTLTICPTEDVRLRVVAIYRLRDLLRSLQFLVIVEGAFESLADVLLRRVAARLLEPCF